MEMRSDGGRCGCWRRTRRWIGSVTCAYLLLKKKKKIVIRMFLLRDEGARNDVEGRVDRERGSIVVYLCKICSVGRRSLKD